MTAMKPSARWLAGISSPDIPFNNNARLLDIIMGPAISATTTAQPASPADGDVYILPATHTGLMWAGFAENDVVIYGEDTWTAYEPPNGFELFVADEDQNWQYTEGSSGGWAPKSAGSTTADDVSIADAGGYFSSTDVEGALQELGAAAVGGGDVTGPASSTTGHVAVFADGTGKEISDGGALGTAAFTAATAYATAAQGTTADTAVQPGDLAAVATSGDVGDLVGFPGGSTNFLREDGTFAAPSAGGMSNPMTTAGDIIVGGVSGAPARMAKGSDGQVLKMAGGVQTYAYPLQCIAVAISDETTNLTTGVAKATIHMPYAFTLTGVKAGVSVAQTAGSILTFDINEAGASILSTKLTIDNSEKTSGTAATPPVMSDTSLADNAEITFDIDQVGTALAKGAKIYLIGYPTP